MEVRVDLAVTATAQRRCPERFKRPAFPPSLPFSRRRAGHSIPSTQMKHPCAVICLLDQLTRPELREDCPLPGINLRCIVSSDLCSGVSQNLDKAVAVSHAGQIRLVTRIIAIKSVLLMILVSCSLSRALSSTLNTDVSRVFGYFEFRVPHEKCRLTPRKEYLSINPSQWPYSSSAPALSACSATPTCQSHTAASPSSAANSSSPTSLHR